MRVCVVIQLERKHTMWLIKKTPEMFWLKHAVHLLTCMSPHITPTHQSTHGQSIQTERGRVMVVRRVTERGEERWIQRLRERERERHWACSRLVLLLPLGNRAWRTISSRREKFWLCYLSHTQRHTQTHTQIHSALLNHGLRHLDDSGNQLKKQKKKDEKKVCVRGENDDYTSPARGLCPAPFGYIT